jgi:uncharacterized protein DUF3866
MDVDATVAAVIRWRSGVVAAVTDGWPGVAVLTVDVTGTDGSEEGRRALAYLDVVGRPEVGDRVLLNTTAQDLGLGTGGYALVVALVDRLPADPTFDGHLVKARYTPAQTIVLGADEQGSPHHEALREADDLDGMPVVTTDLHSALPAIVAGVVHDRPSTRIAYVMTDGGALPIAFSRTVSGLRGAGALCGTVTVGQAYGGDLEAVTVHTGLLAARAVLGADVTVVVQGPGNLGTGTRWGFSGVHAGEVINAAVALGGRAIGGLRISTADPRERHQVVSHHSLTAYGRVALAPADVVVPAYDDPLGSQVRAMVAPLGTRHRLVEVALDGLDAALRGSPVELRSMGRGLDEDLPGFLASAAAGRHAAGLLQ